MALRKYGVDITVAGLCGFGADLICQCGIDELPPDEIDVRRLGAMTVFNAGYIGVCCGRIYGSYPYWTRRAAKYLNVTAAKRYGARSTARSSAASRQRSPRPPPRSPTPNHPPPPANAPRPHHAPPPRSVKAWPAGSKFETFMSLIIDNVVHVPFVYIPTYFITVGAMQGETLSQSLGVLNSQWPSPAVTSSWAFWVPVMSINFSVVPMMYRVQVVGVANFVWTVMLDYITHEAAGAGGHGHAAVEGTARRANEVEEVAPEQPGTKIER